MKVILFIILVIFGWGISSNILAQQTNTKIEFCQFPISDEVKFGNASFSLIYSFKIDAKGKPTKISRLNDFPIAKITKEQVTNCLSKWYFANSKIESPLTAYFRWEHGKGWTELYVSGKGFKKKIKPKNKKAWRNSRLLFSLLSKQN